MSLNPIPLVNSRGNFKLKPPFDTKIIADVEYTVTAIRSLEEISASNENPLEHIYIASGLTEDVYIDDLSNKVPVVILINDAGDYIYVPSNRFLSIPKITGHVYAGKVLTVNVGAIPDNIDLSSVSVDIEEVIKAHLGITPSIEEIVSSARILVTKEDNDVWVARKNFAINNDGGSLLVRYNKLKQSLTSYLDKISKLECYIKLKENQ